MKSFLNFNANNKYCLDGFAAGVKPFFENLNKSFQPDIRKYESVKLIDQISEIICFPIRFQFHLCCSHPLNV